MLSSLSIRLHPVFPSLATWKNGSIFISSGGQVSLPVCKHVEQQKQLTRCLRTNFAWQVQNTFPGRQEIEEINQAVKHICSYLLSREVRRVHWPAMQGSGRISLFSLHLQHAIEDLPVLFTVHLRLYVGLELTLSLVVWVFNEMLAGIRCNAWSVVLSTSYTPNLEVIILTQETAGTQCSGPHHQRCRHHASCVCPSLPAVNKLKLD